MKNENENDYMATLNCIKTEKIYDVSYVTMKWEKIILKWP